jgi:NTP pyrophosphatase (non-canonical NTP hydrolase)
MVEVLGSLSVLVSKKKVKGAPVQKTVAKALAWWLALCGKLGVKSVADLLWGKFPFVCPYCLRESHAPDDCSRRKRLAKGPDWVQLDEIGRRNRERMPKTLAAWQRMFAGIYQPSTTDDISKIFAKLTEEVGELAESIRVFPAEPGYFLSEAADVFAWLMKINTLADEEADIPADQRGDGLQEEFASSYPGRCVDCNSAICTCPPILATTVGRIAHEVPGERSSYSERGSFMTAAQASHLFGPRPRD